MAYRRRKLVAPLLLGAMCVFAVAVSHAQQAGRQGQQPQSAERPATLLVNVRLSDGSPFDLPAVVNLYAFSGANVGMGTFRGGTAEFNHLAPGSYTLEVIAVGYQKLTESVQIITPGRAPAGTGQFGARSRQFEGSGSGAAHSGAGCGEGIGQSARSDPRKQTGRGEKASGKSFACRSREPGRELSVGNVLRAAQGLKQS